MALKGEVAEALHQDNKATARDDHLQVDQVIERAIDQLGTIGILEFVESDDRPTFIVDLDAPPDASPVFYNLVLLKNKGLKDKIHELSKKYGQGENIEQSSDLLFTKWQRKVGSEGHANSMRYASVYWVGVTIRARWRIVSGVLSVQNIAVEGTMFTKGSLPSTGDPKRPSARQRNTSNLSLKEMAAESFKTVIEPRPKQRSDTANKSVTVTELSLPGQGELTSTSRPISPTVNVADDPFLDNPAMIQYAPLGTFDWTSPNPSLQVSAYTRFFRNFNWGATKLGPIQSWSVELRRAALMLLADPRPAALYWTDERVMIYNESYTYVVGTKHPAVLGVPFLEAWAELGLAFEPAFDLCRTQGRATTMDDACFFLERSEYLEETYFSITMMPLAAEHGEMAFYNPVFEVTKQVVADRRMSFLLTLGQTIGAAHEPKDFWSQLLAGLDTSIHDVPFAIVYSAGVEEDDGLSSNSEKGTGEKHWLLEGTVGYPSDSPPLPARLDPDEAVAKLTPDFKEAIHSAEPTILTRANGSLPSVLQGIRSRALDDRCDDALFLPIRSTGENVLGFLILGINPRGPYNDAYRLFIQLLNRQLATAMATAVLFEEEIRRNRIAAELAALDRDVLSEQLALRTHEAREVENRFRQMADLAPVGMFHFQADGAIVYANENWYQLTQHPRGVKEPMSWYNFIHEDDHALMDLEWMKLIGKGEPVSFELRLKKPFTASEMVGGEQVKGTTWIIAAAYPEKAADGTITGILGCITDISRQKWAEDFQTRRTREAIEMKRQQENFIDMTSHEMRNPLSAIIQCADWIGTSLSEFEGVAKNVTIPKELMDSHVDAAQTIVLCAQHQKRIIDDILTLSKLDSDLLLITPIDAQPAQLLESSLKMFDGELQKSDVSLRFRIDPSYHELKVDWVRLDPSRLLQVLINLTTNAIKFTQPEPERRIVVTLGASKERPTERNGTKFLSRNANRKELIDSPDWGTGEWIYLHIEVTDTGRGLAEHEKKLLFQRFSQASPRTHVQYGGSGLGLFISRELTELQGGEIGVSSQAGKGSTFAFFIRARRSILPNDSNDLQVSAVNFPSRSRGSDAVGIANQLSEHASLTKKRGVPVVSEDAKYVLVVEDNLVNQKVLSKQLRSAGCIVAVANHGGEALAFLEQSKFWKGVDDAKPLSVILMDLEMPIMDGLTCVKRIRELQEEGQILGHVPVIAVTANARSEQIAIAKDSGMDGVVTKPFRIPELIPEMERLVRKTSERILTHDTT